MFKTCDILTSEFTVQLLPERDCSILKSGCVFAICTSINHWSLILALVWLFYSCYFIKRLHTAAEGKNKMWPVQLVPLCGLTVLLQAFTCGTETCLAKCLHSMCRNGVYHCVLGGGDGFQPPLCLCRVQNSICVCAGHLACTSVLQQQQLGILFNFGILHFSVVTKTPLQIKVFSSAEKSDAGHYRKTSRMIN